MYRAEVRLIVLTAAAVLLFLTVGMKRPFWLDEANPALWARQDFRGLIDSLRNDNSLPAYYVLLSLWLRIFGDSEIALRSLSAVFYLAAAGVTSLLAWTFWRDRRTALYAGLFYLASTQAIRQGQTVRMYSMLGLLAALSLLLYTRLFVERDGRPIHGVAYLVVNSVGALTQVWFFFLMFAQAVCQFWLLRRDRRRFVTFLAASAVAFGVLWGPIFLVQLQNGSTRWLPRFQPAFLADALFRFYGGDVMGLLVLAACAAPMVLAASGVGGAFWRDTGSRVLVVVFAASILTPLAVSIFKPIYYTGRYTTIALPALAALLGGMLTRLAPHRYALALGCGVLIASSCWQVINGSAVTEGDLPPGQSDRATAEYLAQHASPGDAVVFTSLARPAADYYLRRLGMGGRFAEFTFPKELDRHAGWRDNAAMLRLPAALEAEAGQLASVVTRLSFGGKRVWLYYGFDRSLADLFKTRLDADLTLVEEHDLQGPFHNKLLVYAAP